MDDGVQGDLEKIGAALREARLAALLTQGEVGQRAGVSRQLVSRIEQGLNGEISAYATVAAALQHRLALAAEDAVTGNEPTGLDFG
jgi:transcriptional regulator with XRE-family HTH domain